MGKIAIVIGTVVLAIPLLFAAGLGSVMAALTSSSGADGPVTCTLSGMPTVTVPGYSYEQMINAGLIVAVGTHMRVPERGHVVALATAIQESRLRNLNHGDRDSLGLFQQRPSMGWGTPEQITDPAYAAGTFYEHLTAIPGWQDMSVNDAAQTVQRSATPNAYGQHEHDARALVKAVSGVHCAQTQPSTVAGTGDCENIQAPTHAAHTALAYACRQRGLPYVWGGDGPDHGDSGFDCSGLTNVAYQTASLPLPRQSQAQFDAGPRVPDGQPLLPGDLVYYGTPTGIHHVALYLGAGKMIHAPDFGQPIQVDNYRYPGDDYTGATRPSN